MSAIKDTFTSLTDNIVGSAIATQKDADNFIAKATKGKYQTLAEVKNLVNNVSAIPGEVNEFFADLDNFLIKQHINQVLDIELECRKLFYEGTIPVADGEQVLTNKILATIPYDPEAYTPAEYKAIGGSLKEDTTKQYQLVNFKAMIGNAIYGEVVKGAFTSLPNFQGFLANYSRKLLQSLYATLYSYQIKVLNTQVVNTLNMYDASAKGDAWSWDPTKYENYQDVLEVMFDTANYMMQPTKYFNLGYQTDFSKEQPVANTDAVLTNVKSLKDLLVITNPTFDATVKTKVYSTLFNQQFVNADKFGGMHPLLIDVDQPAFKEYTLTDGTKTTVVGPATGALAKAVPGAETTLYILDKRTAMRWLDRIDTKTSGTWLTGQITVFHIMFTVFYAVKNGIGLKLFYGNKPTT